MELLYRFSNEIRLQIARSCWEAEKKENEAFRWAINLRANEYTNSSLGIGICRCLLTHPHRLLAAGVPATP